ncbi:MAG: Crp/Fnr family transcriptional regulator [Fluviicola sp.]|nr:MAG: Crp/Fnr family transcriptional regulator [Fluviicola sp.]
MKKVIEYINSVSPISNKTITELEAIFTFKKLKKDEIFIDNGIIAKKVGILESGIMRAFFIYNEGKEYNKHFYQAPCFIGGISSLVSGQPNQIIQQALTDCELWEADFSKLTQLYNKHPDLERMIRILFQRAFIQKEQRELEIVLLNADKRYHLFKTQFPTMEQLIPQYHIASYLGITPTQLSRVRRGVAKSN